MQSSVIFTFRRALPSDQSSVAALCAKIWDGDDYIPRCFDEWVADQEGEFTLCFVKDQLAGLSKLTWLRPGEAWFEGLRKDPDLTIKGVGAALCHRYLRQLAHAPELSCIRFSTYFQNLASIKLNEAMGFKCVANASLKILSPETLAERRRQKVEENSCVQVLRDTALIMPFLHDSGWYGRFIHQAWRSFSWSQSFFQEQYIQPGHCLGVVEKGQLKALAAALVDPTKGEGTMPFFDAMDRACAEALLTAVEQRFAASGVPEASAIVPPGGSRALGFLDALGWHSYEREEDYLVYELPLEKLAAFRN